MKEISVLEFEDKVSVLIDEGVREGYLESQEATKLRDNLRTIIELE